MDKIFGFDKAWSYLLQGLQVGNLTGRSYKLEGGTLWCFPFLDKKQKYIVSKLFTDTMLMDNWHLI